MEIIGRLTKKFDTVAVSDKFSKREFILTIDEQTPYPQPIIMQLTQMNCEKLDALNEDDVVKVQFNLRGRQWNGPQGTKWFNTIDVWRVELVEKGSGISAPISTDTRTQSEKDVAAALEKMDPATRAAMEKLIAKDSAPQSNTTTNDDDLPF